MVADEGDLTPAATPAPRSVIELLADSDRPGGFLLLMDRIRQSYVDLDDPTYLDFEYMQAFADIVDALADGPLAVTHIGGGACTFARYIAATRPGSSQIVLEPDVALASLVRAQLPFARGARVRIRPVDGRGGLRELKRGSADLIVLDAFHGGRVPPELTTAEFFADAARVLREDGVLLVNVADGPPGTFTRRLAAAVRISMPHLLIAGDSSVVRLRRFGNLVLAASARPLPVDAVRTAAARAMFPRSVLDGTRLGEFVRSATPLTDADPMRSPEPPEEMWRVG
ncbi:MAG TPA: fused MFS/spermidine synthase [Jatrophihabitantaceae bacterium]|nr:fused MFS/spermidine synthase [Jatrophihabitantaceae bacterium]